MVTLQTERRRPVWEAMSDLFLDTETRWSLGHCARVCAASGYDDATLDRIFWLEVFPEAISNLRSVAGEWAGLALGDLPLTAPEDAAAGPSLQRRLHGGLVEPSWRVTSALTQWLRPLDDAQRDTCVRAWSLFAHLLFQPVPLDGPWLETRDALRPVLPYEWARYRPLALTLAQGDEDLEGAAQKLEALIARR